jgi:hypothetical protein
MAWPRPRKHPCRAQVTLLVPPSAVSFFLATVTHDFSCVLLIVKRVLSFDDFVVFVFARAAVEQNLKWPTDGTFVHDLCDQGRESHAVGVGRFADDCVVTRTMSLRRIGHHVDNRLQRTNLGFPLAGESHPSQTHKSVCRATRLQRSAPR